MMRRSRNIFEFEEVREKGSIMTRLSTRTNREEKRGGRPKKEKEKMKKMNRSDEMTP